MKVDERPSPGATYMSQVQMAQYLKDLRTSKPRPTGSRPPPPSKYSTVIPRTQSTDVSTTGPNNARPSLSQSSSMPVISVPGTSNVSTGSVSKRASAFLGRPIARAPSATEEKYINAVEVEQPAIKRTPSAVYLENGTRWMEKQETKSLRQALEDMDLADEQRAHSAAQDEAAELVWKHQNPGVPYENPDTRRTYKAHLRQGSYNQSHGQEAVPMVVSRSSSGSSQKMSSDTGTSEVRKSMETTRKVSPPQTIISSKKSRTPSGKAYGELADMVRKDIADARRRTSSGSRRTFSGGKRAQMHPQDRIWEDQAESSTPPRALQNVPDLRPSGSAALPSYLRKNPFVRMRMQQDRLERSNSAPVLSQPAKRDQVEIQKNPPSQSRNPQYTPRSSLQLTSTTPEETKAGESSPREEIEIRSDDIRAATSKLRKDRSQHLPQPTLVSDKPGRPIVSFKKDWKPKEVVLEEVHTDRPTNSRPSSSASTIIQGNPSTNQGPAVSEIRPVPVINLPDEPVIPTIVLPEEPDFASPLDRVSTITSISVEAPSISVSPPSISISGPDPVAQPANSSPQRPLPNPTQRSSRHAISSPLPKSTPHYTPSLRQAGVLCAHCALPIAGRVLSAAGERFHPNCFVCHQCHTNLELVAFYPEPNNKRNERIERINARQNGQDVRVPDNMDAETFRSLEVTDGDGGLRFYCHLDFHEHFSPRCKSCKTPIEGEVIVACGAEWHAGHFFCAQCGDPFDSSTPFVEKDGYAWCVGCHTNRYSSKCRKCKKPVTDVVVKALGSDWHNACFRCMECNGEFEDGRYFLRGESSDPVCVKCEERRLKA